MGKNAPMQDDPRVERRADALGAQGAVVARLVPGLSRTIGLLHRASPLTPAARAFVELARVRSAPNG